MNSRIRLTAVVVASLFAAPMAALAAADLQLAQNTQNTQDSRSDMSNRQGAASDARAGSGSSNTQAASTRQTRDVRLTEVVGMNVRNSRGENLGEVKDVILDTANNRVQYVILEFGGFLGLGEKLFAYPMSAFKATSGQMAGNQMAGTPVTANPAARDEVATRGLTGRDREQLVLDVDRARLERAPGFARDNWPDWNLHGGEVDRYWGIGGETRGRTAAAGTTPGQPGGTSTRARAPVTDRSGTDPLAATERNRNLRRASDVLGMDVNGSQGEDAGDIKDVVVSLADGRIRYYVLEFDRAWNLNDKLMPLPPSAINFAGRSDNAFLRVPKSHIDRNMAFDRNSWPNLNDPRYVADVDRYLVTTATVVGPVGGSQAGAGGGSAAAGTAAGAAAGMAQGASRGESFEGLDLNGDGVITRTDLDQIQRALKNWSQMDRDRDGRVTRDEFMQPPPRR